jgi:predicted metal-binding protein
MSDTVKLGIVICDRYGNCGGGKCLRALREREGAFSIYRGREVELVGYANCGGCPGGNVEDVPAEMQKNGAQVLHFATGMVVGYPPCPHLGALKNFVETQYGLEVVVGTHPIPEKYRRIHEKLGSWDTPEWQQWILPTIADQPTRLAYD